MEAINDKIKRIRKEYGDEVVDVFYYETDEDGAPSISIKGEAPAGLTEDRIYVYFADDEYENLADL